MKLVAIRSGGDWNDAEVSHLLIPDNMDLHKEKADWDAWYHEIYCMELLKDPKFEFISFIDWLKLYGAKDTTENEIIEFWDN